MFDELPPPLIDFNPTPSIFDEELASIKNKIQESNEKFLNFITNLSKEDLENGLFSTIREGYLGYELYYDPNVQLTNEQFGLVEETMKQKVKGTRLEGQFFIEERNFSYYVIPRLSPSNLFDLSNGVGNRVIPIKSPNGFTGMVKRIKSLEMENLELKKEIQEMKEMLNKVYYAPNMPGYLESKTEFEECIEKVKS